MSFTLYSALLLLILLLHQPMLSAAANNHSKKSIFRSQPIFEPTLLSTAAETSPTTFFEVTKPIQLPKTKPFSKLILQHDFGFTYGQPPVLSDYTPPPNFNKISTIVLEWTATCKGRQFDRIFGVWLGGVEILRSCTAEPTPTGITWTVKKDITRYYSLLQSNQTLAVYLGNLVNDIYTGIYHVNVTFHFYPFDDHHVNDEADKMFGFGADLILPISQNEKLNDRLWFRIDNSAQVEPKEFEIPQNVYKAVLEVYVSFHENDEFWYRNFPNEYISMNNLTDPQGNGPFREVVVRLDDLVIGAVWPFTVIYTGGLNPLLWRPITGIGSFDLPTYDIEVTPFLGLILDGKTHKFGFSVTNALNLWYIDANLHLWLDKKSEKTQGKLLTYNASPVSLSHKSNFTKLDGNFVTNVSRSILSSGYVRSSYGEIKTKSNQEFEYSNVMVLGNYLSMEVYDQVIFFNGSVETEMPLSSPVQTSTTLKKFEIHLYSNVVNKGNVTREYVANVTLGLDENLKKTSDSGISTSKIKNLQTGQVNTLVKGNLVGSRLVSTQQEYHYSGDQSCYYRNIGSSNYTILHDEENNTCNL